MKGIFLGGVKFQAHGFFFFGGGVHYEAPLSPPSCILPLTLGVLGKRHIFYGEPSPPRRDYRSTSILSSDH